MLHSGFRTSIQYKITEKLQRSSDRTAAAAAVLLPPDSAMCHHRVRATMSVHLYIYGRAISFLPLI